MEVVAVWIRTPDGFTITIITESGSVYVAKMDGIGRWGDCAFVGPGLSMMEKVDRSILPRPVRAEMEWRRSLLLTKGL